MKIYCVIPTYNEERFIAQTLESLVNQTFIPEKIVVVNDNSTDGTAEVVNVFTKKYSFIQQVDHVSANKHLPGSKVIRAFQKGLEELDNEFDVIVKLDSDLILPKDYFEKVVAVFESNHQVGMVGGVACIEKKGQWVLENLTDKNHIRGAFKAYRKECFEEIGGLKPAMGWDTVDELLGRFYQWEIVVLPNLKVKHLKPTGSTYTKRASYKQGEAFYTLGYGFLITVIASFKLSILKRKPLLFIDYLKGFFKAKVSGKSLLVTEEQARFIRAYRWKKIKEKMF